jgi:LPXTG-site transpeptidase (sortase) family protein
MKASRLTFALKILPLYGLTAMAFFFPFFYKSLATQKVIASNQERISQTAQNTVVKPAITALPANISLPRLDIHLNVEDGYYDPSSRQWTLSRQGAFYATGVTTPLSNKKSNTLIYGHNRPELLKPTEKLIKGDQLLIKGRNGKLFEYYYTHDNYASPEETSVLNLPAEKPEVRLMTCEGTFYQYRRIMVFKLLKVS